VLVPQVFKGYRTKHFRTNRDILGETDARHRYRPGTWQMSVHHDFSLLASAARSPLDETNCAPKEGETSLGQI
jgi:hypothetical protein